jgi:sialic acid synthase SpsE
MRHDSTVKVAGREISAASPTYFIADIAANHDGDLSRAKDLIHLAKEAGADAAKFQHFLAKDIVSDAGFKALGAQLGHQSKWKKSVYEIYEQYECPRDWTEALVETCEQAGIHFMTSPYDFEAIDRFQKVIPAYKIGSGDITWIDAVERIADKGKPVFLATGASTMEDVERAVEAILARNRQLILMQCNTNYTGSAENFRFVNLRVLQSYALRWPGMLLGLSDHTPGHATVLGAIALGARAVEKHFTDDTCRDGPDHPFSMTPKAWREMVDRARELENALGDGVKRIEENERDTAVLQRRCLRLTRDMRAGEAVRESDLKSLRPAPAGAVLPYAVATVIGRRLAAAKRAGDALNHADLEIS